MTSRLSPPGCVRGRPRVPPEERARRISHAVELLRAGTPRKEIAARTKVGTGVIASLAREHGIPHLPRIPDTPRTRAQAAVRAEREAHALELLRTGHTRTQAVRLSKAPAGVVKRMADALGVGRASRARGMPSKRDPNRKDVTAMTDAELDALEADVAARRAVGLLPPIVPDR